VGNRNIMKLGDKEVEYNPDFRFYLTTKLNNPHYTPEISTKATIVNFCVKQQGLEEQLLGTRPLPLPLRPTPTPYPYAQPLPLTLPNTPTPYPLPLPEPQP
jgi:hypothetical protein